MEHNYSPPRFHFNLVIMSNVEKKVFDDSYQHPF